MQKKTFTTPPRRVALFVTCMVDMMYPEVGMATVELLERQGVEVVFPVEQTCCGQPAFNAGYRAEARQLAQRFVDIFWPLLQTGEVEAIVAPSGSCTTMTTHFYDALFEEPAFAATRQQAAQVAAATFELTEFLVDVLGMEETGSRFRGKVTYHACCHLLRELQIDRQPRTLLENMEHADFVELDGAEECCGFGGLFSIKNAPISTAMGQRKTQNLARSNADVVAMCDVSCMTHINGLLGRQAQRCRAIHIAEVLNSQVDVEQAAGDGQAPPATSEKAAAPKTTSTLPTPSKPSRTAPAPKPRRWQEP